jgi:NAD(P)-dependent dehydrogenase (short-subunit alcohol dehydrogenase family)
VADGHRRQPGAGKAIAMELGAAGATVYVTGRSTRGHPAQSYGKLLALSKLPAVPGNIDDTADEVTRLGGKGIAVPCDHTKEEDVAHLFARVQKGQGRLDLLVNNAWGGHETFDGMFDAPSGSAAWSIGTACSTAACATTCCPAAWPCP